MRLISVIMFLLLCFSSFLKSFNFDHKSKKVESRFKKDPKKINIVNSSVWSAFILGASYKTLQQMHEMRLIRGNEYNIIFRTIFIIVAANIMRKLYAIYKQKNYIMQRSKREVHFEDDTPVYVNQLEQYENPPSYEETITLTVPSAPELELLKC